MESSLIHYDTSVFLVLLLNMELSIDLIHLYPMSLSRVYDSLIFFDTIFKRGSLLSIVTLEARGSFFSSVTFYFVGSLLSVLLSSAMVHSFSLNIEEGDSLLNIVTIYTLGSL